MTCSTCDGYELVASDPDDPMSRLVSCPDCPPVKLRCPVHGRIVSGGSTCCECSTEARDALELMADLSAGLHGSAQSVERAEVAA